LLLEEISGIRRGSFASTFPSLELDIRLFIMAALDAPIRFDRSSIKTVS